MYVYAYMYKMYMCMYLYIYVSCDRISGRFPQMKKGSPDVLSINAPAASTVIRQFSRSFSMPFRSCQLHQTTCIHKKRGYGIEGRLLRAEIRNA